MGTTLSKLKRQAASSNASLAKIMRSEGTSKQQLQQKQKALAASKQKNAKAFNVLNGVLKSEENGLKAIKGKERSKTGESLTQDADGEEEEERGESLMTQEE